MGYAFARIDLVFLFIPDIESSKRFYVEGLGFRLEYEGEDFVRVRGRAGPSILLHRSRGREAGSGGFELELEVDDVDGVFTRLSL